MTCISRWTMTLAFAALLSQNRTSPAQAQQSPENESAEAASHNGLTQAEQARFYHLAEGSEVFPLNWLRALESQQTGRPFLENIGRFGLLADPDNPDGLPVGLTAD